MATTAALGTAAPLGSFTVPVILPPTCAKRVLAQKHTIHRMNILGCMELVYAKCDVPKRQEYGFPTQLFCPSDGLGRAFD
jgi:hypothetical protein